MTPQNKHKKEIDAIIEEFDRLYIHENHWKSDNEEYAYAPIEGMRRFIFDNLQKIYSEGFKEGINACKDKVKKECLDYCSAQNGLPYCKNCGLSDTIFASLSKEEDNENNIPR